MSSRLNYLTQSSTQDENDDIDVIQSGGGQHDENADQPSTLGKRKLTSEVWLEMTRVPGPEGVMAKCNYCGKLLVGDSNKGTSHLKKHIKNCLAKKHAESGQQLARIRKSPVIESFKFDQERSRLDLARMIIKHNYPFNMVEHEYFETFVNNLQPNFKIVSRNTVRSDVITVYNEEKEKLYKYLDNLSCRFTITTNIWTSDHSSCAYASLTAHFVDDNWELQKKILAFRSIPYPHDGETLFRFISDIILEWNIDKKLFSIVVDNASSNDSMVRHLKSWLLDKSLLSLGGDIFHVRCSAHILNLVVQDGLACVGGRVIDESRAALLPDIVEALVAAGDWLESKKKKIIEPDKTPIHDQGSRSTSSL